MDLNILRDVAVTAALEAGKKLKEGFGSTFKISSKEGVHNLVTEYDLIAERTIISTIKNTFPDHFILSEEAGENSSDSEYRWIIDPLDGTVNFAHSIPIFCVSIGVEFHSEMICGVIYNPMLDELFIAEKGKGATLNGELISVSTTSKLADSILVTGFPYDVANNAFGCIDDIVTILKLGLPIRRLGSAALDLAYLAAGRFDGYWESKLNPWDIAAGMLIVREAGGKITHYDNSEYQLSNGTVLATNSLIHSELSKALHPKM
jgi:myo-inositol-1(or 4)-monophosphatase